MPSKKQTDASRHSNGAADDETPTKSEKAPSGISVEDLTLPKSMISRLAKGVLPANTQINKDALLAMSKSATVFVSYLAGAANDRAVLANKKTVQPADVLEALKELEFDNFLPRCEGELTKHVQDACNKRNSYRHRVKEEAKDAVAKDSTGSPSSNALSNGNSRAPEDGDIPPAAKKARTSLAGDASVKDANGTIGDDIDDDTIEMDDEDREANEDAEEDDEDEDQSDEALDAADGTGDEGMEDYLREAQERVDLDDDEGAEGSESD